MHEMRAAGRPPLCNGIDPVTTVVVSRPSFVPEGYPSPCQTMAGPRDMLILRLCAKSEKFFLIKIAFTSAEETRVECVCGMIIIPN